MALEVANRDRPRRGLALPAVRSLAGGYFSSRSSVDLAWGDLLLALCTPVGSRPMRRSFGSGLHGILMNRFPDPGDRNIAFLIEEAARLWTPYVTLLDVQVQPVETSVQLNVAFRLSEDNSVSSEDVSINRASFIRRLGD